MTDREGHRVSRVIRFRCRRQLADSFHHVHDLVFLCAAIADNRLFPHSTTETGCPSLHRISSTLLVSAFRACATVFRNAGGSSDNTASSIASPPSMHPHHMLTSAHSEQKKESEASLSFNEGSFDFSAFQIVSFVRSQSNGKAFFRKRSISGNRLK